MFKKVLIVDDDTGVRDAVRIYLLMSGYHGSIIEAQNGEEGLQRISASSDSIDMVITDCNMPKMGGLEMITKAREEGYQGLIYLMSGIMHPELSRSAVRVGATAAFQKTDLNKMIPKLINQEIDRGGG